MSAYHNLALVSCIYVTITALPWCPPSDNIIRLDRLVTALPPTPPSDQIT